MKSLRLAGLATMMVGRSVVLNVEKDAATPGEVVLQIENLHVKDDRNLGAVNGFDLQGRAGEIVGDGCGRQQQCPQRTQEFHEPTAVYNEESANQTPRLWCGLGCRTSAGDVNLTR